VMSFSASGLTMAVLLWDTIRGSIGNIIKSGGSLAVLRATKT
jgi:hypothetical protein